MSRKEHFSIFASIILISTILSVAGVIQGLQIIAFSILAIVGQYLALYFVKYVYDQKNYTEEV